jgi:hypothetical protein
VAIWDCYLAYGAALGVTGCAGDVLDLEMGDRRKVWSSCRGGWRRIKVRYPAAWPWSASTTRALVLRAALFIATAAVVLAATGPTGWISLPGYALLAGASTCWAARCWTPDGREAPAAATVMDIFGEERPVRLGPLPVSIEDVARLVGRSVRARQSPPGGG